MNAIDAYLDTFGQSASLAVLAKNSGLSIPHFIRIFRKRTGYSPFQYAIRKRIGKATTLLLTDNTISIKQAAMAVGCEDQHYFSRIFKKMTGHTPVDFRARYKQAAVNSINNPYR